MQFLSIKNCGGMKQDGLLRVHAADADEQGARSASKPLRRSFTSRWSFRTTRLTTNSRVDRFAVAVSGEGSRASGAPLRQIVTELCYRAAIRCHHLHTGRLAVRIDAVSELHHSANFGVPGLARIIWPIGDLAGRKDQVAAR